MNVTRHNRKLWRINADQLPKQFRALSSALGRIPRWIERHDERLQRLADDLKFEVRTDWGSSEAIVSVRAKLVERQHHRINSFVETTTAAVTNYARRRHYAQIVYNDRNRDWFGNAHFPWARLEERLRQKAEAQGLNFLKDIDEKSLSRSLKGVATETGQPRPL